MDINLNLNLNLNLIIYLNYYCDSYIIITKQMLDLLIFYICLIMYNNV